MKNTHLYISLAALILIVLLIAVLPASVFSDQQKIVLDALVFTVVAYILVIF